MYNFAKFKIFLSMACNAILPILSTDFCDPEILFGQVSKIFLTRDTTADVLSNVESVAEWTARINNATTGNPTTGASPIRELPVVGSISRPEATETVLSLGRKKRSVPEYTAAFRVDELSTANVDFFRQIECAGGATLKAWFLVGDKIFGGNEGVSVSIYGNLVIPESDTELSRIEGELKFKACLPEMNVYPLAA